MYQKALEKLKRVKNKRLGCFSYNNGNTYCALATVLPCLRKINNIPSIDLQKMRIGLITNPEYIKYFGVKAIRLHKKVLKELNDLELSIEEASALQRCNDSRHKLTPEERYYDVIDFLAEQIELE